MSTVERDHEQGGARIVITKGARDILLKRCNRLRLARKPSRSTPLPVPVQSLTSTSSRMRRCALWPSLPQAVAGEDETTQQDLEHDLMLVGLSELSDPPRAPVGVRGVALSLRKYQWAAGKCRTLMRGSLGTSPRCRCS